jgi:hypothetical protein
MRIFALYPPDKLRRGMRLLFCRKPRFQVGELPVIKQACPKTGGVILFYDFLNSPAANPLAVF